MRTLILTVSVLVVSAAVSQAADSKIQYVQAGVTCACGNSEEQAIIALNQSLVQDDGMDIGSAGETRFKVKKPYNISTPSVINADVCPKKACVGISTAK